MEKYSQVIFDKNTVEFVTVAAEYCGFLERARDMKRYDFVDTALKILPLLYLKATLLPPCEPIGEDEPEIFVTEEDYELIRRTVAGESSRGMNISPPLSMLFNAACLLSVIP